MHQADGARNNPFQGHCTEKYLSAGIKFLSAWPVIRLISFSTCVSRTVHGFTHSLHEADDKIRCQGWAMGTQKEQRAWLGVPRYQRKLSLTGG